VTSLKTGHYKSETSLYGVAADPGSLSCKVFAFDGFGHYALASCRARTIWGSHLLPKILECLALIFLASAILDARVGGQSTNTAAASQVSAPSTYPKSVDALKRQLEDLFGAVKAGDAAKSAAHLENFAIPNHQEWFVKTFGPMEGARFDAKYTELRPTGLEALQKRVDEAVKSGRTEIEVSVVEKPADTKMRLPQEVIKAMAQPNAIYLASDRKGADDKSPYSLGDFVYVDGAFRVLDWRVMQALSTAPRLRVTIGGNVQREKLVSKVEPVYPREAIDNKIEGTVVLHVVLGTEGNVVRIEVASGHPLLVQAATDAVRQWRYRPTLLNGEAVEVDTQINVIFSLRP
jgi:TonB family protein